jgi:BCCT family betaine/carnitine transporter
LLICLPIALIFSDSTMNNLQTVSMIAAFPIGFIVLLILASFIKDARRHLQEAAHGPNQGQTDSADCDI